MASTTHDIDRTWTLMKDIGFCMLSTRTGEDIRARPMSAHVEPMENAIYFLTDARSAKDDEIESRPNVGLAFSDPSGQKYVSLSGTAEVSNDRELIRELWSTPAKAWWDSPDDPEIRVLRVTPKFAEYWDSPGTMVSYIKMMAAAVTDTRPDMGDNAKVSL
ncbi:pyridoxamine 5'-phosphate oxidase family protein [Gellertiella hungarica]|uniref:General stress protein 26 n=1 Tax=Gellertiella hungarica TaxID=1572859 RepID=A0A7W6J9E5_9HYPH|nr:pyridoxamine 5'-phosphate oxidase family protein [Gellertiella hungarica]MBB4067214.1 general stress protein 26 [Gellertiella hungarica]